MLKFLKSGYQKIKEGFSKARFSLGKRLKALFERPWNDETIEELEHILYEADLGMALSQHFVECVQIQFKKNPQVDLRSILQALHERTLEILNTDPKVKPALPEKDQPLVILIVGTNGSGKTTSIAKLAKSYQEEGKKVLFGAGDTFRAAAIDQLNIWAERLNIEIVKGQHGSDPSAVAYDALQAAKARKADVVIIDTAGRLQNKTELMHELQKIQRTCQKIVPHSPHETLLVLDATSGQNALDQAEIFHKFTPLTGVILTKLDGTAKGGMALAIYHRFGIPIRWIGTGESIDDFTSFDSKNYADLLLGDF